MTNDQSFALAYQLQSLLAVTEEFFKEYCKVFKKVEGLTDWNTDADRKRLFTQKLFNRLMFIAFIQKKDWLKFKGRTDYLSALWEAYLEDDSTLNKNFYRNRLSHLFFTGLNNPQQYDIAGINKGGYLKDLIGTVPYLNGGLFEQAEQDLFAQLVQIYRQHNMHERENSNKFPALSHQISIIICSKALV